MAEGNRNPTLEDVARAAGVSRALVSIVMREAPGASESTRARVFEVAEQLFVFWVLSDCRSVITAKCTAVEELLTQPAALLDR